MVNSGKLAKDDRFGRLVVIDKTIKDNKRTYYNCKCDCGNYAVVSGYRLTTGVAKSCGCLRSENSRQLMDKIREEGVKKLKQSYVDGTSLVFMQQKISKNSTTGIKGVAKTRNGKYRAHITVRRKQIHLGIFETKEEAMYARVEAEKQYYQPLLDKYLDPKSK
ncbi:TPA: hypothetical protein U1628_000213 [Streptococcus suis]|nr:hypothetical protein [Streptococcus suis]HEM5460999.1 hypothetical protein [Streptococcus suis]